MRTIFLYIILIKCVESKPPLRIIGGRDAENDEYPFVVRLELHESVTKDDKTKAVKTDHVCSGSVVSPSWTISASHCFHFLRTVIDVSKANSGSLWPYSYENYNLVIRYGSVNATTTEKNTFFRIDYYVKHPAFRIVTYRNDSKVENDLALVHHQPISLTRYAKVAGLDFTSLSGHEVTIAGYGFMYDSNDVLIKTLQLLKPLQVLSGVVIRCPPNKLLYPALCIARLCEQLTSSTCNGDSGGPVFHSAGIVSIITKGLHCGGIKPGIPNKVIAYTTPLSPYLKWIAGHVKDNNIENITIGSQWGLPTEVKT